METKRREMKKTHLLLFGRKQKHSNNNIVCKYPPAHGHPKGPCGTQAVTVACGPHISPTASHYTLGCGVCGSIVSNLHLEDAPKGRNGAIESEKIEDPN